MTIIANKVLEHLLDRPFSYHYYHHMMSLYDQLTSLKVPFQSYKKFFESQEGRHIYTTSFTVEIDMPVYIYQKIPKFAFRQKQAHPIKNSL